MCTTPPRLGHTRDLPYYMMFCKLACDVNLTGVAQSDLPYFGIMPYIFASHTKLLSSHLTPWRWVWLRHHDYRLTCHNRMQGTSSASGVVVTERCSQVWAGTPIFPILSLSRCRSHRDWPQHGSMTTTSNLQDLSARREAAVVRGRNRAAVTQLLTSR